MDNMKFRTSDSDFHVYRAVGRDCEAIRSAFVYDGLFYENAA